MSSLVGVFTALPQWARVTLGLGVMSVALAGLALTAGIAGTTAIEVKDAVIINQTNSKVFPTGASLGVTTRDDGTKVNIGITTFAGDVVYAQISLNNQSSNTTFDEELTLELPSGITAEVTGGSAIQVSLAGKDKYLVRVTQNAAGGSVSSDPTTGTPSADELEIKLEIGAEVPPGIQSVSFDLNLKKDES